MSKIENLDDAEKELYALAARVDKAIAFFENIEKAPLDETIYTVGDFSDEVSEKLVPVLKHAVLDKWNKRAIKIEKVNDILAGFEQKLIAEYTRSNAAIALNEINKAIGSLLWLASNKALLLGIVKTAVEQLFDVGTIGFTAYFMALFDDTAKRAIADRYAAKLQAIETAASLVAIKMIVPIVEAAVVTLETKKFREALTPLLTIKKDTEVALMAGAFPQGKGRVRRVKVHRIRKRR